VATRTGKSSCSGGPPGTPTTTIDCSAGTFCYTPNGIPQCQPGCTSDENCGPSERCIRCDGPASGQCNACNLTDEEACRAPPKEDAGPPTCDRDTFFDQDCAAPGKAFSCPSTVEPTGQGTCTQTKLPGVFCCGGGLASSCKRDTSVDMDCTMPGPQQTPPKGYRCDINDEPTQPGCVHPGLGGLPNDWCCPT
jgi:hypothetical protein